MDLYAFQDELEKIAGIEAIIAASAIGQAGSALLNMPFGGKSWTQRRLEEKEKKPGLTESQRKRIQKAKKDAQINADVSRALLLTAPAGPVGLGIAHKLGKTIEPSPVGFGKSFAKDLGKALKTDIKMVPVESIRQAMMVPEGGTLPRPLRFFEKMLYRARDMPMDEIEKAIERGGAVFAPMNRSPEILAHELGHASLRNTPLKRRLWGVGRVGVPIAAAIGAGRMLESEDPKDWKVKAAPAVAALGLVPLFADEGLASKKGLEAIRKLTGKSMPPKMTKIMKSNLIKAIGTYGAVVGFGGMVPIAAMAIDRALSGKSEK